MSENKIITSDIYNINSYVNDIMRKHINIDNDTQYMGIFGYLNDIHSLLLQNQIIMSSELSNEAIPISAKYDKSIMTHAAYLGINDINATPSYFNVMLFLVEDEIEQNMKNDTFIYDREIPIYVGDYEFHTEYDIIINKTNLATGETVYTARYDISVKNPISNITNPYLNPPAKINMNGTYYLILNVTLRQTEIEKKYNKVMSSNSIESKMFTFEYEGQLADFQVDVVEGDKSYHLIPYYNGTTVLDNEKLYCYYTYLDENTIRVKFMEDSYYPKINCDVTITVFTTKGAEGNFKYTDDIIVEAESSRYNYSNISMLVRPVEGESINGTPKKSIKDLKRIIPKEALSRGNITTATDLNNFFNVLDIYQNCSMYFYKKRDNQLERLYYSYLILKDDYGVVPTNTVDLDLYIKDFTSSVDTKYVIPPGTPIYLSGDNSLARIVSEIRDVEDYGKKDFLYTTPFMIVINSKPLSVSYYLNIFNKKYYINFGYINQESTLQFITNYITWKRPFTYDRDTYTMKINITQNISEDQGMLIKDDDGEVIGTNIKVLALVYNDDNIPYRWIEGYITDYDESIYSFDFELSCKTEDIIDKDNKIRIEGTKDIGSDNTSYGYFKSNCKCEIYVLVKQPEEGGRANLDSYIPNLEGWTLCNRYDVNGGIDFFINYTEDVSSSIIPQYTNMTENLPDLLKDTYLIKKKVLPNSIIRVIDEKHDACTSAYFGYNHVNFNRTNDIMSVYRNGQKMVESVDYTINEIDKTINSVSEEGWSLDPGSDSMVFEFIIMKNAIKYIDSEVSFKFEITRNGFYVKQTTNNIGFIGGEIINFDRTIDQLEVYMNGLRLTEGVDYTIDNTSITKIAGQWICDDKESKNFFEFIRIRNNKFEETEDSTAIVVGTTGDSNFKMSSIPVVKYDYIVDDEVSTSRFINQLELRKGYIDVGILKLENQFGIDFKFVNTYGPSKAFYVTPGCNIDRVNLTMNFRMKVVTNSDKYIKEYIIDDLKEYIEDIEQINDIHIPNIITEITSKYRDQLVYFEFLGFNEYGPGYQHIYQNEDVDYGLLVPEFLNIYTKDNAPSINIEVL